MLLRGGRLNGKRYLPEAAVRQMTSRQTPPQLKQSYGFGLAVGPGFFGHGGAYSTNTTADTRRGLILVWLNAATTALALLAIPFLSAKIVQRREEETSPA
jgi:CubicO group peptidase (beta-lactamase class C family)